MLKARQSTVASVTDVHAVKHELTQFLSIETKFLGTPLMLVLEWGNGGLNVPR